MKDQKDSSRMHQNHPEQKNPNQVNPGLNKSGQSGHSLTGQQKTAGNEGWNKGQETSKKGNQNWDDEKEKQPSRSTNQPGMTSSKTGTPHQKPHAGGSQSANRK